jgi:hypothetical protein
MILTETGMPGYFQITAEGDNFKVVGEQIPQGDTVEVACLIHSLTNLLAYAIGFAKDKDMVGRTLADHDLIEYKGES